jgi:hypothetical protein
MRLDNSAAAATKLFNKKRAEGWSRDGTKAKIDNSRDAWPPPVSAAPMTESPDRLYPRPRPNRLLFRLAVARARPCYCYGCICLTKEERAYERRVFRLAHAWGEQLKKDRERQERERQGRNSD